MNTQTPMTWAEYRQMEWQIACELRRQWLSTLDSQSRQVAALQAGVEESVVRRLARKVGYEWQNHGKTGPKPRPAQQKKPALKSRRLVQIPKRGNAQPKPMSKEKMTAAIIGAMTPPQTLAYRRAVTAGAAPAWALQEAMRVQA